MNEAKLWALLEEQLSTTDKEILDRIWTYLNENFSVEVTNAWNDPQDSLEDLVFEAEKLIDLWRLGQKRTKPAGRSRRAKVEVELNDNERINAETVSLYLAKQANSLIEVQVFRNEELGGKLLKPEEAEGYLRRSLDLLYGALARRPRPAPLARTNELARMGKEDLLDHLIPPHVSDPIFHFSERPVFPRPTYEPLGHTFGDAPTWVRSDRTPSLEELGVWLATLLPWESGEAAWFVLTGDVPAVIPLELYYHRNRRTFTLTFAPWISEGTIKRAYRGARDYLGKGDNHPLNDKTLEVLRFVMENEDEKGALQLSWEQLRLRWNKVHGGSWGYRDKAGLHKAYRRAIRILAASPTLGLSTSPIAEWRYRRRQGLGT